MIPWRAFYPLIILLGLATGYWALRSRYARSTLTGQQKTAVGLAAFIGGMLGAKAPFLLSAEGTTNSWFWLADGKTILGGIFGGYLAVEITKRFLSIRSRTGDNFAVPVAMAVAISRLGCFVGGCCYGQVTELPWGVHFPLAGDASADVLRHPTQLYESLFHFLALGGLLLLESRSLLPGRRLTVYLLGYLAYRFVTEWIRPEPIWLMGLTAYQVACVTLAGLLVLADHQAARASRAGCSV